MIEKKNKSSQPYELLGHGNPDVTIHDNMESVTSARLPVLSIYGDI